MNFLSIQLNNNKFLIPGGPELISEGDEAVLLSQTDRHNRKKHLSRLKCIKVEPGTKIIIISLQPWETKRLKRTKNIIVMSGMILDKSILFDDDPTTEPTCLYYSGPDDNTIRFLDFNSIEEAALWAAVQDPTFTVSDDDDAIF